MTLTRNTWLALSQRTVLAGESNVVLLVNTYNDTYKEHLIGTFAEDSIIWWAYRSLSCEHFEAHLLGTLDWHFRWGQYRLESLWEFVSWTLYQTALTRNTWLALSLRTVSSRESMGVCLVNFLSNWPLLGILDWHFRWGQYRLESLWEFVLWTLRMTLTRNTWLALSLRTVSSGESTGVCLVNTLKHTC